MLHGFSKTAPFLLRSDSTDGGKKAEMSPQLCYVLSEGFSGKVLFTSRQIVFLSKVSADLKESSSSLKIRALAYVQCPFLTKMPPEIFFNVQQPGVLSRENCWFVW